MAQAQGRPVFDAPIQIPHIRATFPRPAAVERSALSLVAPDDSKKDASQEELSGL